MIFETEKLIVRKLIFGDLAPFHELESNPLILQYATGNVKSFDENKNELEALILKYDVLDNDFWIYAVERKSDSKFVGTVAFIKDGEDDEIGYRFLQKYWKLGYGSEICEGIITYSRFLETPKLIGYVVDKNIASAKILKRFNFTVVNHFISKDIKLPETKYELIL